MARATPSRKDSEMGTTRRRFEREVKKENREEGDLRLATHKIPFWGVGLKTGSLGEKGEASKEKRSNNRHATWGCSSQEGDGMKNR